VTWPAPATAAQTEAGREGFWFNADQARPHTRDFVALLREADQHGLDPSAYRLPAIESALSEPDPVSRREAGILLSEALAAYARDLRVPRSAGDVTYIDPELVPTAPAASEIALGPDLVPRIAALQQGNPVYDDLRAGLADYRRTWSALPQTRIPDGPALAPGSRGPRVALLRERLGLPAAAGQDRYDAGLSDAVRAFREAHGLDPSPVADLATIAALNRGAESYERIIIANLDRVRGLPTDGQRYILVDTAGARLQLIANGKTEDSMKVIVGKPGMETPLLAGFIRYAMVNPYWNVPPDLVRTSIAPAVMKEGVGTLARRRFVLSSDWRSTERIDPAAVDWPAVAAGRASVWVRQLPGGGNMMGKVKFMLPNDMGIYLHDTPDKSLFQRADRRLSSGCVRVEDAERLAIWLFGRPIIDGESSPDTRIDLARPVAVFTTYLTAKVENGRIRFLPDAEEQERTRQAAAQSVDGRFS
jgi:murein L,D-transpeptidase YcbB/YkuD